MYVRFPGKIKITMFDMFFDVMLLVDLSSRCPKKEQSLETNMVSFNSTLTACQLASRWRLMDQRMVGFRFV